MAEQRLNGSRVGAVLHEVCSESVPKRVRRDVANSGRLGVLLYDGESPDAGNI